MASAIVIPVPTEPSHPESISSTGATAAPPLKRRQSDLSETDSKRRRLSTDDAAKPDTNATSPPRDERRKSRQIEERKRGQRLFGALLGTLSQGSSNAAQKRRADIEKRQQAKLKQQDEEDAQRRRERLENLRAIRRKEQVKYEENTVWGPSQIKGGGEGADEVQMRIRHANMLHFARFLRTKAEPRIVCVYEVCHRYIG